MWCIEESENDRGLSVGKSWGKKSLEPGFREPGMPDKDVWSLAGS